MCRRFEGVSRVGAYVWLNASSQVATGAVLGSGYWPRLTLVGVGECYSSGGRLFFFGRVEHKWKGIGVSHLRIRNWVFFESAKNV